MTKAFAHFLFLANLYLFSVLVIKLASLGRLGRHGLRHVEYVR
jgi:hypothetical protein